jgi:hypothetical protein
VTFRDRPPVSRLRPVKEALRAAVTYRRVARRPFSLAVELRVLAIGLFAVAGAGFWLSRSQQVAPSVVLGAAGIVVAVFVLNVTVGLVVARRSARETVAEGVEN